MTWLIKIPANINKKRTGFTLVELMVVVVVVAILAAAAMPIYKFAVNRAYASEGMAAVGGIRAAELVWKAEYGSYLAGSTTSDVDVDTVSKPLFDWLGVDVDNNSWWTTTNATFTVDIGAGTITATGTGGKIADITLVLDMANGTWTKTWPA